MISWPALWWSSRTSCQARQACLSGTSTPQMHAWTVSRMKMMKDGYPLKVLLCKVAPGCTCWPTRSSTTNWDQREQRLEVRFQFGICWHCCFRILVQVRVHRWSLDVTTYALFVERKSTTHNAIFLNSGRWVATSWTLFNESVFRVALRKTAEKIPRADRSRRKGSMQLTFVAESKSRMQLHCTWHRVDRRIAKIWREFVNMVLQQADSAWLHIEFIFCFGPSRISCLVKGWNCSLGDLSDRQSLRFHGWCGWQTSCWESLLWQSSPHPPKRPRCKALHVVRCPFLPFFDFIPWENSGKHLVWTRTRSY